MKLDPTEYADWQLAAAAEENMAPITRIAEDMGLEAQELLPYGHHIGKIDYQKVLQRLENSSRGKYIIVTAITPTPLGEGKSTTTIGLTQGFGKLGKKASAAIRQPSGGPTMGVKGSAAGGGLAQCIPLTPYSLGFTGDINAVMNAHNLSMTALTARMQHERNYDDVSLERLSGMKRLDIDPTRVSMGWVMDFCCQALRNIIIGIDNGSQRNGFMMQSHFDIAVASEVMTILSISKNLADLRQRMGKIIMAYDRSGKAITTEDLRVAGAMTAWMVEAVKPNLIQTMEGQPVLVHAGPFANIALGQSSVIADYIGTKCSEYHITEAGFGSDIGYEKFWNLKCRSSGLTPDAAVIVTTIRALKNHGGIPSPAPGRPLPEAYKNEDVGAVERGCANLLRHIEIVKLSGVPAVVCINAFSSDTAAEIAKIKEICEKAGARVALSTHWQHGGDGAVELAEAVMDACREPQNFRYLYADDTSFCERIERIAWEVYGAEGVEYSQDARSKLNTLQALPDAHELGICMVKTQYSLSDVPSKKGVPERWKLYIRDLLHFGGAGLVAPVAGDIMLMPGTGSSPSFRNIDVDTETGKVLGLF